MASFSTSLAILLLLGAGPWRAECACIDRTSDTGTYSRLLLENKKVIWWCTDGTRRFPGGQRIHESNCTEGEAFIDDTQLCTAQSPAAADDTCDYNAFADPPNARRLTISDKPRYVKYYVCFPNYAWLSGRPGRFTQCIGGSWTAIMDQCVDACDPPRDCSDIAKMGFNTSDVYRITPSGRMNGVPVDVYCTLSTNNTDNNGWTTAMTLGSGLQSGGSPVSTGGGIPGPPGSNRFFIGIQHLSALTWNDTAQRPLVFKFVLQTASSKSFTVYYDGVVIDMNTNTYTLRNLGSYHGTPGDAFRSSLGKDFPSSPGSVWWNANIGEQKLRVDVTNAYWDTLPGGDIQLSSLHLMFRPKAFDMESSCPPAISYDQSWISSTSVVFPVERKEGTVISYRCEKPMYMEGNETVPISSKTFRGNVTCTRTNNILNWDRVPVLPCRLACPPDFVPNKLQTSCNYFSANTSPSGITSASLYCSRSYNATLGTFNQADDLSTAVENVTYYTAHVRSNGVVFPPEPSGPNITCASDCQSSDKAECLVVSKGPTTFSKKFKNCYNASTHYSCQLPVQCPTTFSPHKGLCYKLIDNGGSMTSFKEAQNMCRGSLSALAYVETLDALNFIKHLVWVRELGDGYKDNPTATLQANVSVLIGLNDASGTWNSSWYFEPDSEIVAMAGVSNGSQFYRYVTVGTNKGDRVAMAPADYIVAAPGVTIKYAVCQLYGPDECLDGPPPASANMTLEWDNSTAFGATANYRCVRGYFMDETTLQKVQTVECRGHLGGWVAPEYELFNCTLVEVCNESSLPCAGSPLLGLTVSPDFLTLDSSIVYSCPPGMQMPGFLTTMNASCTDDTSTDPVTYKFSPSAISDCNICAQAVNVTNATTTWVQGTIYTVGQKVNVQCIQNHLMKTMYGTEYSNVTIACTYFGWWLPPGGLTCVPACAGDPPAPGANMSIPTIKEREVGANLKYSCDAGLYIPAALPNITNHTTIRCNESLLWEPVSLVVADLLCTQMCLSDPFMPVSPANTTWDRIARVAGTTINITCPEGFAFPDFNNTIVLTCGVDGNWTEVVPENAFCRRYTMEAPVTPNGSVYDGPSPPHWESTILDFTCPENLMSRDGLNSTWTIFNGTVWEPFDPEFACLNVCGDPIPAVSPVMMMNFTEMGVEGDTAIYECLGGFEGSDAPNITSVCKDGNWTLGVIPVCKMCGPPPAIPLQGSRVGYGIPKYGAVVTYNCNSGYFETAERQVNVTCVAGSWIPAEVPGCIGGIEYQEAHRN